MKFNNMFTNSTSTSKVLVTAIGKRNEILVECTNWPLGGAMCPYFVLFTFFTKLVTQWGGTTGVEKFSRSAWLLLGINYGSQNPQKQCLWPHLKVWVLFLLNLEHLSYPRPRLGLKIKRKVEWCLSLENSRVLRLPSKNPLVCKMDQFFFRPSKF